MTARRSWGRWTVLALFAVYFLLPFAGLMEYSLKDYRSGGHTLDHWGRLGQLDAVKTSALISLELAAVTVVLLVVLLVPTMVWTRIRVPWARRPLEFACMLPLAVPPLVLVVGLKRSYSWVYDILGGSSLTLCFAYVVLVLPYAYRAIDSSLSSVDAVTLTEAARSLGASWTTVVTRVIVPNITSGVVAACFIAIAVSLGEYVFASLMHFDTLPTRLVLLSKDDGPAAMAITLVILALTTLLLIVLSTLDRRRTERTDA